jgi:hypothetical protein
MGSDNFNKKRATLCGKDGIFSVESTAIGARQRCSDFGNRKQAKGNHT